MSENGLCGRLVGWPRECDTAEQTSAKWMLARVPRMITAQMIMIFHTETVGQTSWTAHTITHRHMHTHTHTRVHTHTRKRTHTQIRTYAHMHTRTRTVAHAQTHTGTRARTRAHTHTNTHAHTMPWRTLECVSMPVYSCAWVRAVAPRRQKLAHSNPSSRPSATSKRFGTAPCARVDKEGGRVCARTRVSS